MDERRPMDEFRDLVEGRLPRKQEEDLLARCKADPDLRARLDSYLEAHALTKAADVNPPRCRVRFEEVEARLRAARWRTARLVLAAAAALLVLALASTTLGIWGENHAPRTVPGAVPDALVLRAIPAEDAPADAHVQGIPTFLADYQPVADGRVRWLTSYENARDVARASERSLVVFLQHPTCPACVEMRETTLSDPEVVALMTDFVPTMIDVSKPPPELDVRALAREGWPWLGVIDGKGEIVIGFPGKSTPADFAYALATARDLAVPPSLSWDRINSLASRLLAARQYEAEDWICDADAQYRALGGECPEGPLREEAARGARRLAQRARQALLGARTLAAEGEVAAALEALDAEIRTFEDTPFASDFRAARAYLATHGSFPALVSAGAQ